MGDRAQQDALLELLNTTPVVNGVDEDHLADPQAAARWQKAHGGRGTAAERKHLVETRDALQAVARGQQPLTSLAPLFAGVAARPCFSPEGVTWQVEAPEERRLAVGQLATWSGLQETMPGRLRPCANPECRRFLLDRSKADGARWCSMAVCGNRMKARRHYERTRDAAG